MFEIKLLNIFFFVCAKMQGKNMVHKHFSLLSSNR
nr:MAG TPA: hypothetical protein [Caudoviricetes sp.]